MSHKELIAKRVAEELNDGDYVNLGIGIPTLVSNYIPVDKCIMIQSENGILGLGDIQEDEACIDKQLTNAGGKTVNVVLGASYFNSFQSFSMIRGGHVDVTVLGALEVDEKGNLANWMVPNQRVMGMGGAMDLVVGSKKVMIAMEHTDKYQRPKIVKQCRLPLTAKQVVDWIITEMAVIEVTEQGLVLREVMPGATLEAILKYTEAELLIDEALR